MADPPKDFKETSPSELGGTDEEVTGIEALPGRVGRYGKARASAIEMLAHLERVVKLQSYRITKLQPVMPGGRKDPAAALVKLENCGNWLAFAHFQATGDVRLTRASLCKEHLLCPLCAIRRGVKLLQRYLERFEVIQAEVPALRPYLLTLTVKNGPDLVERFKHLQGAWRATCHRRRQKSRQRAGWLRDVAGGVTSYEVTYNPEHGWHPHLHSVILAASEPSRAAIEREWLLDTGDSFVVDLRPFQEAQDPVDGFLEVFKYAVKFGDLAPELRWEAFLGLQGRRLLSSFGCFRGVEVPEGLLDDPFGEDEPFFELFYRFNLATRAYHFEGARAPRPAEKPAV